MYAVRRNERKKEANEQTKNQRKNVIIAPYGVPQPSDVAKMPYTSIHIYVTHMYLCKPSKMIFLEAEKLI